MEVKLKPGKYVIAVSGGVDSMVLLNLLSGQKDLELIVAHYDHGIRQESGHDLEFVKQAAERYGCGFRSAAGNLGEGASEALARNKRYEFLRNVQHELGAVAILTAHHEDDLVETMVLNLLRGTHRRGLSSLQSNQEVIRPLLGYSKKEIIEYANLHRLQWVEDSTNSDTHYLRNYIRHHIIPRLTDDQRNDFVEHHKKIAQINNQINQEIAVLLQDYDGTLHRSWLVRLPFSVGCEVVAQVLRNEALELSKFLIQRTAVAIKTLPAGKQLELGNGLIMKSHYEVVSFVRSSA